MTICERMFSMIDSSKGALKQADLCRILEIQSSTMSTWKRTGKDPDAKYIARISDFLGCSIEYLLTGQGVQDTKKEPIQEMSLDELEMLELFRTLPYKEQQRAIGRLQTLVEVSKESSPQQATGGQSSGGKAV